MNSLTSKAFIFLCALLVCGCAAGTEQSPKHCVEKVLHVKVVKVDENNQRYFIAAPNVSAQDIVTHVRKLQSCFTNSPWKDNWSLSLFSDPKYAGYKDEKDIIPYHKNNLWAKAYIAEYDSQSNTLISYPAYKPKQLLP